MQTMTSNYFIREIRNIKGSQFAIPLTAMYILQIQSNILRTYKILSRVRKFSKEYSVINNISKIEEKDREAALTIAAPLALWRPGGTKGFVVWKNFDRSIRL
jgi:hypothetical protein